MSVRLEQVQNNQAVTKESETDYKKDYLHVHKLIYITHFSITTENIDCISLSPNKWYKTYMYEAHK